MEVAILEGLVSPFVMEWLCLSVLKCYSFQPSSEDISTDIDIRRMKEGTELVLSMELLS